MADFGRGTGHAQGVIQLSSLLARVPVRLPGHQVTRCICEAEAAAGPVDGLRVPTPTISADPTLREPATGESPLLDSSGRSVESRLARSHSRSDPESRT